MGAHSAAANQLGLVGIVSWPTQAAVKFKFGRIIHFCTYHRPKMWDNRTSFTRTSTPGRHTAYYAIIKREQDDSQLGWVLILPAGAAQKKRPSSHFRSAISCASTARQSARYITAVASSQPCLPPTPLYTLKSEGSLHRIHLLSYIDFQVLISLLKVDPVLLGNDGSCKRLSALQRAAPVS